MLNKCAHRVIGYKSYRINTSTFLSKLNWLSFYQMVIAGSLKTIHKMVHNNEPIALIKYLYNVNCRENTTHVSLSVPDARFFPDCQTGLSYFKPNKISPVRIRTLPISKGLWFNEIYNQMEDFLHKFVCKKLWVILAMYSNEGGKPRSKIIRKYVYHLTSIHLLVCHFIRTQLFWCHLINTPLPLGHFISTQFILNLW